MSDSKVDHNSEKWIAAFDTDRDAQAELESKTKKFAESKNIVSAKKELYGKYHNDKLLYKFTIITIPRK